MTSNRIIHIIFSQNRSTWGTEITTYLNKNFRKLYPTHKNIEFQTSSSITNNTEACLIDPPCFLEKQPLPQNLKWAHSTWAGVDGFVNDLQKPLTFQLTRSAIYGRMISEYIICNILNYERQHYTTYQNQLNSVWDQKMKNHKYSSLSGRKMAILGSGEIGTALSKMMKYGFNVETAAALVRRDRKGDELVSNYFTSFEELAQSEIAKEIDYLVNILPSTKSTKNLLNFEQNMKNSNFKNVVFINVGRGSICTENDLHSCLDNKIYKHAILDVFPVEPLPEDSKLWKRTDVILTPHISGKDNVVDLCRLFMENLDRYLRGDELKYCVDVSQGY